MSQKRRQHSGECKARVALAAITSLGFRASADMVTDWNANTEQAILAAAQGPPVQGRFLAIVHAAIYDAVNGIEHKYTPYFVTERGPRGASADAAAVQAAYTALVALYPTQKATFEMQLADSLEKIAGHKGRSRPIARERAWGEHVANQILAWRATDGFATPLPGYFGSSDPGVWRSPPAGTNADGTLPAILPQNAILVPFAMTSHDQFRPGPPPALTSPLYAADLNEVKAIGRFDSAIRTAEQTQLALLWQAVGPVNENHAIRPVIESLIESHCRHWRLVDTARIFALINFAAGDATIAGFDVDPADYSDPGAGAVADRTIAAVQPGSIVSLHFGHSGTIDALPPILDALSRRNLRPVNLSALLA